MNSSTLLRIANYTCIVFLSIMLLVSFRRAVTLYNLYGVSYTVTTIINGEVSTQTITVYANLAITVIFLALLVVNMLNTLKLSIYESTKREGT